MASQPVLIDGIWRESCGSECFHACQPETAQAEDILFPLSPWEEVEAVLQAASRAFVEVRGWQGERFAKFLEAYAKRIEKRAEEIVVAAYRETALPVSPRLKDVELPRTTNQLRLAAKAARDCSWSLPTIDSAANIRSLHEPIGPVVVFGPNNFPLAFNGIAGGDFAAAIAAGNPVIAKGHPCHPMTTKIMAEEAQFAAQETEMPTGFVQLIYRTSHEDGMKLVADFRLGATGYTGSRQTGLLLKEAADRAGKPIYLELSSTNPVVILPASLEERATEIAGEFTTSCLMGTGQFCTNPGMVILCQNDKSEKFLLEVAEKFDAAPVGTLLSLGVRSAFAESLGDLINVGAEVVAGGNPCGGEGYSFSNTLLRVSGGDFLKNPEALQQEVFGNSSLFVFATDCDQLTSICEKLEGNLTGCLYSHSEGLDDHHYDSVASVLRSKVGRLLNDKMPTGVAVSSAMNHGGPYPATGHAGFTSVGMPASIRRFSMLACYDNVRENRLPLVLRRENPNGEIWRLIDGTWSQADFS